MGAAAIFATGFVATPAHADASTTFPGVTINKTQDGQPPYDLTAGPGSDTNGTNNEVRAGDLTKYTLTFSLNDANAAQQTPYDHVTFTSNQLNLGAVFDMMPSVCLTPTSNPQGNSTLTGDGITTGQVLTCDMGTWSTGSTWGMSANIRGLPTAVDGTQFTFSGTVSVPTVPNTDSDTTGTITVRTQPRIDLVKSAPHSYGNSYVRSGQTGYVYSWGMGLKYRPGSETVALPVTWTDDLAEIAPGAELIGCNVSGYAMPGYDIMWAQSMPYGKINSGYYGGWYQTAGENGTSSKYSVEDSGTISCTQNGTTVDVSVSGVHTNPATYPSKTFANAYDVNPGDRWIGSYNIAVWVPDSAFIVANGNSISTKNKLTDFAPVGAQSGNPNFGDPTLEPGRNMSNDDVASQSELIGTQNQYRATIYRPSPGWLDKYDYQFSDHVSSASFVGPSTTGYIWGGYVGSNARTGDGVVARGNTYSSITFVGIQDIIDIPSGFIACTSFDNTKVNVEPLPGHPTRAGLIYVDNPATVQADVGWVMEYGTGGAGGVGTTWATETDNQRATCLNTDSKDGWWTDITQVPGGLGAITKVRVRSTDTFTVAEQQNHAYHNWIAIRYKALESAPLGSVTANYSNFYDPSGNWFGGSGGGWSHSAYNVNNATGGYGDRITIVGSQVRIAKSVEFSSYRAGQEVKWTLTPSSSALGVFPAGTQPNTRIVDTVPTDLSYVTGSAVCSGADVQPLTCEPLVTVNGDGTSTLTWEYGTITAGDVLNPIVYRTLSDPTIQEGTSKVNTAIISSDADNSPVAARTAQATANISNPAAFSASKRVMTPLIEKGDPITYRLKYVNSSPDAIASTDFVDWIPFIGDQRVPASNYHGDVRFTSFSQVSGAQTNTIMYTKYPVSSLIFPTGPGATQGGDFVPTTMSSSIIWCSSFSGGTCPASADEVTGVRFQGGSIASATSAQFDLVVTPSPSNPNKVGDVYTNRYRGIVAGLPLPIESNNVAATVIGSTIGDKVFTDFNKNGVQDIGDTGVAGVTVKLYNGSDVEIAVGPDGIIDTSDDALGGVTTDANGNYRFRNLHSGDYKVGFGLPSGYLRTTPGLGGDSFLDSDADVSSGMTGTISLGVNATNLSVDSGIWQPGKLSGHVYVDPNQDNSHAIGANDVGLRAVQISLSGITADGNPITLYTTTDANGNYEFANLPPSGPSGYTVTEGVTFGYNEGADYAGSAGGTSGADTITAIALLSGADAINYDFTEVPQSAPPSSTSASLSGAVKVNGANTPIAGVQITLSGTDTNGNAITRFAVTDSNGEYSFTNLPASNSSGYTVSESQPAGFNDSTESTGSGAAAAGTAGNDVFSGVVLNDGNIAVNYDFTEAIQSTPGTPGTASLSGVVVVNGTSTGIVGVLITLTGTDTSGNAITRYATTGAGGTFSFTNLPPSNASGYTLVETQPAGYNDNSDYVGTGATTAGTAGNDTTTGIVLGSGDTAVNYQFTESTQASPPASGTASIGGSVKVNGTSTGIAGVLLTLTGTDANGNVITRYAVTASNGTYSFTNLPESDATGYSISETQPAGYDDSTDSVGSGAASVGFVGADILSGIQLAAGNTATNYNFTEVLPSNPGVATPASLSGSVKAGAGTQPIAGVLITLTGTDASGNAITRYVVTDSNGTYTFTNLPPSNATGYTVTETQPAGFNDSTDTVGTGAGTAGTAGNDVFTGVVLSGGNTAINYDFAELVQSSPGVAGTASLSGKVVINGTATGISGVLITLTGSDINNNTITRYATTDANGVYSFPALPASDAGGYTVTETQPAGFNDSTESVGSGANSIGTAGNDVFTAVVLAANDTAIDYTFSEVAQPAIPAPGSASIAGKVLVNGTATPIVGVLITLTGTDTNGNSITRYTITDGTGSYLFATLPASNSGGYTVTETQPHGYDDASDALGTGAASAGTLGNDVLSAIVLNAGQVAVNYTFTEALPASPPAQGTASVRGSVLVNGTSTPIAGVRITLSGNDENGNAITRYTATDATGAWEFTNLPASNGSGYSITETQPAGFDDSQETVGTGAASAGTASNDQFVNVVLAAGSNAVGYVFTELAQAPIAPNGSATLSGLVLVRNSSTPIAGVLVTLTGTDVHGNSITKYSVTNETGSWSFTNLPASDSTGYTVTETQPAGYLDDTETLGTGATAAGTISQDAFTGVRLADADVATNYVFGEATQTPIVPTGTGSISGSVKVTTPNTPIAGVLITLTGTDANSNSIAKYAVTDAMGNWSFGALPPGTYSVTETQPAGFNDSSETVGTGATTVGNANTNDTFASIVIGAGDTAVGYVFGEALQPTVVAPGTASIRGKVVVTASSTPIAGVLITLSGHDSNNNAITLYATTDATGAYEFLNLPASDSTGYTVSETQPSAYNDGPETVGTGATTAGSASTNDAFSGIVLASGDAAINYNFGEVAKPTVSPTGTASISGFVKARDTSFALSPISGVLITLTGTDVNGNVLTLTTTTDSNGAYEFLNLPPSNSMGYTVTETQPTAYDDGPDTVGTGAAQPGTPTANDVVGGIVLVANDAVINMNFVELVRPVVAPAGTGSLSGRVMSASSSGGASTPVAGVILTLTGTDSAGNRVELQAITGVDGRYTFTGIPVSNNSGYTLTETQPAGYQDGAETPGTGAFATGSVSTNDTVSGIRIAANDVAVDYNFNELTAPNIQPLATSSITGHVLDPIDGRPVSLVTITLTGTDTSGNAHTFTTVSDSNGAFVFSDLPPGVYTLVETQPTTHDDADEVAGSAGGIVTNDRISSIELPPGTVATGYVFHEHNRMRVVTTTTIVGTPPTTPAPVISVPAPVSPTPTTVTKVSAPTTTVANQNAPVTTTNAGPTTTSPSATTTTVVRPTTTVSVAGSLGTPQTTVVGANPTPVTTVPFAEKPGLSTGGNGVVTGSTYQDRNRNGKRDTDETGISGVKMRLTLTDGTWVEATSDSKGIFTFPKLPAGEYTVDVLVAERSLGGTNQRTIFLETSSSTLQLDFGFATSSVKGITIETARQMAEQERAMVSVGGSDATLAFTGRNSIFVASMALVIIGLGFVLRSFRRREDGV